MRRITVLIMAAVILLASSISSYAMGFDAEETYNSIFVITTESSIGSGFALGKNIIATNMHVVENSRRISITTYDGKTFTAEIIASDSKLDIAFLAVEDASFVPLNIGNINDAKIGDDIYTVGAPNSMAYTLTKGVISAKDRNVSGQKYIQIDAAINSGNSGGPLLDDTGSVLGMNTLKMSNSEGIGLAIPITRISEYAETNGISFDSVFVGETEKSEKTQNEDEDPATENNESSSTTLKDFSESFAEENDEELSLPIIITVISVLAVAIFAIIIVYKKNSGKYISKIDPSERTDFEIDIEE